ncbi:DsrE family protein [Thiomicrorhabdus lithotrophica]|uniref:DsrE family protein n=1 Tax=Thiomicrorhabdus lithotrophica TaxID=2949997 RepID=A0ABY8C9S3_9GAMM|nr:DsrE family protein [Thiomicrorhabdus lithotrophica]WEJ62725.1 DsrE family protein [Thiomicrorhabdus lithotrophica]
MQKLHLQKLIGLFLSLLVCLPTYAAQSETPLPDTFAENKVVLQISDSDPFKQTLVLNVAGNLQRYYEAQNVDIEVVAFGPGVRLMFDGNTNSSRINNLIANGVRFSACDNTINNMAKKLGYKPKIQESVVIVPAGAGRILQLNKAGWQILKP